MDDKKPDEEFTAETHLVTIAQDACEGHPELLPEIVKAMEAFLTGGSVMKALGIPEEILDIFYEHAYHQYKNGLYKQALGTFTFLCTIRPDRFDYAFARAATLQHQKQYDQAILCYNIALAIDPNNPKPYYHMAECYEQQGKLLSAYQTLAMAYMYAALPGRNAFADRIANELKRLEKKMGLDEGITKEADARTDALMTRLNNVQSGKEDPLSLCADLFIHRQAVEKEIAEHIAKSKR